MARPGSETIEKARIAFIELIRRREHPTPAKIRSMIGGGGTDLIGRVIREMQDELYEKMFSLSNRPDVPSEIIDSSMRLWELANNEADKRFDAERLQYEARLQESAHQLTAAEATVNRLTGRVEDLEAKLSVRTGEVASLQTSLGTAESRISNLEGMLTAKTEEAERIRADAEMRIRAAETHAADQIREAEVRYQGLEHQLHQNAARERTQHEQETSNLKKEIAKLTKQCDRVDQDLKTANAQVLAAKDESTRRVAELAETKGMLKVVTEERDTARKEGESCQRKLATSQKQLDQWKRRARSKS